MIEQLKIPIVQIGSSKGIRIPKKILDRLGMKDTAVAVITDNSITLTAESSPRNGWIEDYKRCHEISEDKLSIDDDLDIELWEKL